MELATREFFSKIIIMKRLHTYSQNFLVSPRLVLELIGHSNLRKNDLVLDIGAGSGVISSALARRVRRVIALEAEPRTADKLRHNMMKFSNVEVVEADFLRWSLPRDRYKVFANIPFHLSSQIVQKLTTAEHPPRAIYLIVQRQFAKKLIIDQANFTGWLGASLAPWWTSRIRRPLQKTDFYPRPNVDTCLLELKLREQPLLAVGRRPAYQAFVEKCFAQQKFFAGLDRESVGISAEKKPSELTTAEWLKLFAKSLFL